MLGSVIRAAVSVPQGRMELLARIASDLANDNAHGDDWFAHYDRVRNEGPPAPQFERNKHGHILFTITGLSLAGQQDIERLTDAGFRISDLAKSCLTSTKQDGYDKCHRLEDGREYKIALVPTKDVGGNRTTAHAREYGTSFGYGRLLAGGVPRIRETVSDEMMEEMGFWYIAALHDPITDSDGRPLVLRVDRDGGGQWVSARWGSLGRQWHGDGAFAFLVPAS
ncbi:MAG: hypothetical protein ACI9VM_000638 [Candidatus Azotimanducaceae bacterium]|jgi:hypothetical protein